MRVVSNRKNSRFPRGQRTRSEPCRFPVAKNKKARQILADLSGLPSLAKPTSLGFRQHYEQNFIVLPQSAKLTIFCPVLQEFICLDDPTRQVVHHHPLPHLLPPLAF